MDEALKQDVLKEIQGGIDSLRSRVFKVVTSIKSKCLSSDDLESNLKYLNVFSKVFSSLVHLLYMACSVLYVFNFIALFRQSIQNSYKK